MKKNLYYRNISASGRSALDVLFVLFFLLSFSFFKSQVNTQSNFGISLQGSAKIIVLNDLTTNGMSSSQALVANAIVLKGDAKLYRTHEKAKKTVQKPINKTVLAELKKQESEKLIADIKAVKTGAHDNSVLIINSKPSEDFFSSGSKDNILAVVNVNPATSKIKVIFKKEEHGDFRILSEIFKQKKYAGNLKKGNFLLTKYLFARPPPLIYV